MYNSCMIMSKKREKSRNLPLFLEVLCYLLMGRCGTLQLVTFSVLQVDEDNEAALDLLSALFKHCHSVSLIYRYLVNSRSIVNLQVL